MNFTLDLMWCIALALALFCAVMLGIVGYDLFMTITTGVLHVR